MLRIVNLFIALSFGVQREQLEHRMGLTCPRPFLFRPLDARFLTMVAVAGRLVTSVVCDTEVCNLQLTILVET